MPNTVPATRHVDVIDLARVLLLLVIFICHAVSYLPNVAYRFDAQLTGYALQLFFIISGFGCMLSALRRPPEPTAHYFKRKLKKFYPLHVFTYVVALVLVVAAARQTGTALDAGELAGESVVNLLLLQSWSWSDDFIFSFNGVSWFLSSLLFCYLLAPWLARRLRRLSADGALVVAIAAAAASYAYAVWWDNAVEFALTCFTDVLPPFRFLEFAIGGCIAVVYRSRTRGGRIVRSSIVQVGAVVAFLAVYCVHLMDAKNPMFSHAFIFPETLMMFAACCCDGVLSDIGRMRVVQKLSALSMPFFMTHSLVILIVQRYVFTPGEVSAASIAMFFVTLALALVVAYAVMAVDKRVQHLLA